ncbi:MAG: AbrB family transcriptional regulator [Deltaproteobacteria bacterium CG03_land_8_20_14_0_80_45_14]|jgi:bifunctional DNA-binding transcriptional regulator/antitoxin component of YhaV-PrlF toxin-antitoxin module|nr:MAG: AbrB family transcriptional regulator [Deltaproteobacteria bacterium CG03_land_8_20_14_0_80_45_14]
MESIATAPKLVRVRSRGQLTIPQDMREALSLDENTGLSIFRVGKVLIMSPKRLQRASLAKEVEREMKRQKLTLKDLISDLRVQREKYLAEAYPED